MKIAIIGCGNMGSSLAQRLSAKHSLTLYDHTSAKAEELARAGHGKACKTLQEAMRSAEMVILAIKPQSLKGAAGPVKEQFVKGQILVSLLAGTTLELLKDHFPKTTVVRMMPNVAVACGEGVVGLVSDPSVTQEGQKRLTKLFEPLGKIYWLSEEKLEALGALAGSGPAFFFTLIEAMIDAGIAMGLTSEESKNLAQQMVKGSLALLETTQKHPGELKWQVTSPGGTTIAGLRKLEELAVRGGVINTFLAAYERSKNLSG
jgi:pyrroline-5-carboxylate reductase